MWSSSSDFENESKQESERSQIVYSLLCIVEYMQKVQKFNMMFVFIIILHTIVSCFAAAFFGGEPHSDATVATKKCSLVFVVVGAWAVAM